MAVSILERTTQTVTICHAIELLRKARQLVTDCHRFKVAPPYLTKKEALSGLEKGLVLATCHIMTNEEEEVDVAEGPDVLGVALAGTVVGFSDLEVGVLLAEDIRYPKSSYVMR